MPTLFALQRKTTGCEDSMKRRLHILHCWSRLPRQCSAWQQTGFGIEQGQVTLIFYEVYRARRQHPTFSQEEVYIKMQREGRLLYCKERNRWNVHDVYDKPAGMHCGECFEIQVGQSWLPCRIELDKEWFVIFSNSTIFHLHPKARYNVRGG